MHVTNYNYRQNSANSDCDTEYYYVKTGNFIIYKCKLIDILRIGFDKMGQG